MKESITPGRHAAGKRPLLAGLALLLCGGLPAGAQAGRWIGAPEHGWACHPFATCADALDALERRIERRERQRRGQSSEPAPPRHAGDTSPWGAPRALPPPTPESEIQPDYREASRLRPEFRRDPDAAP
jgi:hypothetical protein